MRMTLALVMSLLALAVAAAESIRVGSPASGFTVVDDHGVKRSLADYRGKFVVLEWHEKGCPYVTKHYRTGHMQGCNKNGSTAVSRGCSSRHPPKDFIVT